MLRKLTPWAAAALACALCAPAIGQKTERPMERDPDRAMEEAPDEGAAQEDPAREDAAKQKEKDPSGVVEVPSDPADVLRQVQEINGMEVALSSLALSKAKSEKVREFAQMMETDHEESKLAIAELAREKDIELSQPRPAGAREDEDLRAQRETMDRLRRLDGDAFDRAYMEEMVRGHQRAITFVRSAIEKVGDQDIIAKLNELLPTLEKHLAQAEEILVELAR